MSDILLKSIHFPSLDSRYIVGDDTMSEEGAAADAKATGDALATKADKTDTYTKAQVDTKVGDAKAELEEAIEDLDERKANSDGYYETFTSGQTEQIIATEAITDTEPYIYRKTGGSADVGDRVYDTLVGGSVVWNQLVPNGNFSDATGWAARRGTISVNNGIATVTATSETTLCGLQGNFANEKTTVADHKYLLSASVLYNNSGTLSISFAGAAGSVGNGAFSANTWTQVFKLYTNANPAVINVTAYVTESVPSGAEIKFKDVFAIDLTAALGSTIADYVYTLEQATAGAGVAWVRKYFPGVCYAYAEPHFEHVQTSAKETVGFNQWDEEAESGSISIITGQNEESTGRYRSKNYVRVIPGTTYYLKCSAHAVSDGTITRLYYYDESKGFIESPSGSYPSRTFTVPDNCHYVRFFVNEALSNFNHDICINIHGDRDGEYEPYRKRTYPIEAKVLRGIPKLDSANRLYFDGDLYQHDGSGEQRYAENELSDLSYEKQTVNGTVYFMAKANSSFTVNGDQKDVRCWCSVYSVNETTSSDYFPTNNEMALWNAYAGGEKRIVIRDDSVTTVADLKTKLVGKGQILSNLKTPEPFTAEPFQSPMVVDPLGTERFIDYGVEEETRDVAIPVGHTSEYPPDLRGKLQHLPSLASADGRYVVVQSGNQMSLTPDTSLGLIAALEARVAALEGGNG